MARRPSRRRTPHRDAKIRTRAFRVDDYDAAAKLWRRVEGVEIAEGDSKAEVARFLKRNRNCSRVALAGSTIVGVALCGADGRRGHIYHLAVEPTYRGRGVGKLLVDECLERLRAARVTRAIIMVAADNPHGRSFWRSCGWEEIGGAVGMGIDL